MTRLFVSMFIAVICAGCSGCNPQPATPKKDGGADASVSDAAPGDAGNGDAAPGDAGGSDAGAGDAGNPDAAVGDAGTGPVTRIWSVHVVDQRSFHPSVDSSLSPGASVTISDVPIENSIIRIELDGAVDPTSVTTGTGLFCTPTSNITVSAVDSGGTPISGFVAEVCASANVIEVRPAVATCDGPEPFDLNRSTVTRDLRANYPGLLHGAQYTIAATGVRGSVSGTINFSVTVKAAGFEVLAMTANGSNVLVGGAVVPPGKCTGSVCSTATVTNYFGQPSYGTPIDLAFSAPVCQLEPLGGGLSSLCDPTGGNFYGAMPGVSLTIPGAPAGRDVIDCDATSDSSEGGDQDLVHLTPVLPLEDAQTYAVKLDTTTHDMEAAALSAAVNASFQSAAQGPVWNWTSPAPGATGHPVSTDPAALQAWFGELAVGFAASRQARVDPTGAIIGATFKGPGGVDVPGVSDDSEAYEARGRSAVFGVVGGAKKLALQNATTYTMSASGAKDVSGNAIPDATFSFTTVPFQQDVTFPGMVDFGQSFRPNKTNVNLVNAYGTPSTYMVFLTGPASYDTAAATIGQAIPAGTFRSDYFPLTAGSVTLTGPTGVAVAGASGYLKFTKSGAQEPWEYATASWPGSILAFTPTQPLAHATQYTLAVTGVQSKTGTALPAVNVPFTTWPFVVSAVWDSVGVAVSRTVSNGIRHTVLDPTAPFTVRTTGLVDVGSFPQDAVQLLENGTVPIPITLTNASPVAGPNHRGFMVAPVNSLKHDTSYTLSITALVADVHGVAIQPTSAQFVTEDNYPSCTP